MVRTVTDFDDFQVGDNVEHSILVLVKLWLLVALERTKELVWYLTMELEKTNCKIRKFKKIINLIIFQKHCKF